MKINYSVFKKRIAVFAFASFGLLSQAQLTTTVTFNYTGATQTFVIPSCVGSMTVDARGASGGLGAGSPAPGLGGTARGVITATPGQVLYINVGGQGTLTAGGFNGGGNGSAGIASSSGGGGGASDVRLAASSFTNRIIVAAGGGGSGGNGFGGPYNPYGGNGGGGSSFSSASGFGGQAGQSSCGTSNNGGEAGGTAPTYGTGGGGAGLTSGGSGGGQPSASPGGLGCNGLLGVGGDGGGNLATCGGVTGGQNGGGGGGGGWYGGGGGMSGTGGCNGGGGGGSSYASTLFSSTAFTSGLQSGNGIITIVYTLNGAGVTAGTSTNIICSGSTVTLTAASVVSYTWLPVGSFLGSNSTTITDAPTSNVVYTVQGTNSIGCISTTFIPVSVNPGIPSLTVANTASATSGICPTKTVMLTASGALTYTWTGASPTVTNGIAFAPSTSTTYVVTGENACGTNTAATSVSIHPFPTVNPSASSSSVCSGNSVSLTATGNATNYTWSGGSAPGGNGVGFSPVLTATYTVIGTSALSCTASATIPVTVVATPSVPATANPALICIGKSSTLIATGATNYTWSSAIQTVNTSTFLVTPAAPGVTTYTITRSNSNCSTTQTISVVTNSLPNIFAIVTPTIVCALNPATLAIGGAQTYTWTSPGPPSFSFTGASPVVSPPVPTIYTVAASDGTCVNTTTVFLAVNPNPTLLTTTSSTAICNGQSVTVNVTGGINYTWTNTANTNTYNTSSVTESPTTAVSYNVVGDNSFGCTSGASQIVLVNPNPTITISATKTLVCSGGASTLTASGANTYSWDPVSILTNTAIVNPVSPTSGVVIYTVEGTYTTTTCKSTKTIAISVFVPTLTITGNTNTCYGGALSLSASGGNNGSYSWNLGTGTPYTFPTLNTTLTAATIFTVSATTTSISVNCPVSQTVAVGIYYNPTITAVPQRTTICFKESVELYAGGGATYVWSNNQTGGTITVNPTTNTTYTVTGTDANGCVNTGTVLVKVSGCAGIHEINNSNSGVDIYPNPNNGEFVVRSNEAISLSLVNELGQIVRAIALTGINDYKVSVSDLAKGIYFVTGQNENLRINQKIVVAR